jgi:phosphoglycolate phosphatase
MMRNIIFDWSGTLSNNVEIFHKACDIIFQKLGREPISDDEKKLHFNIPYMLFWNRYFPDLTQEEEHKIFTETMIKLEKPELYDGVTEVLQGLKAKGIRMFLISSDDYATLDPELEKSGISDLFEEVLGLIHEKEPAIREMITKHELDTAETMFVGDSSGEMETAKKLGLVSVGITWGFQHRTVLEKSEPDHLIDDIKELNNVL